MRKFAVKSLQRQLFNSSFQCDLQIHSGLTWDLTADLVVLTLYCNIDIGWKLMKTYNLIICSSPSQLGMSGSKGLQIPPHRTRRGQSGKEGSSQWWLGLLPVGFIYSKRWINCWPSWSLITFRSRGFRRALWRLISCLLNSNAYDRPLHSPVFFNLFWDKVHFFHWENHEATEYHFHFPIAQLTISHRVEKH